MHNAACGKSKSTVASTNNFPGSVPVEVLKRYEKWKDIARLSGPQGLRAIKGFHDEALSGEWKGYRSSRFGLQWRVIYRVVANVLQIQVIHVTAHDLQEAIK